MTKLSIIVVTYNPGELALGCLDTLAAAAEDDWEIIVVDNQSTDGMIPRIQERFPQFHIIVNAENKGFAGANNVGLAHSKGEFLILLNPDVLVEKMSFPAMIEYLQAHPKVGIVGPRTFTNQGKVDLSVHAPLTVSTILWQFWGFDRLFPYYMIGKYLRQAEIATEPFEVAWVQGHCFMFRRSVYEQIGNLDEGLFLYNEEPDYCDRAAKAGWKTVFVPQSTVVHLGSTTISRYTYWKMLHTHISMLYFFRKRGEHGAVRLLKVGFVIELLVKWAIRATQSITSPTTTLVEKVGTYGKVIQEVIRY